MSAHLIFRTDTKMIIGLILGISACFIWGLIFLIPDQLTGFSPIEVSLGRYFFYGLISFFLIACKRCQILRKYPLKIWLSALKFALFANIVYYTALVLGVRYANSSVTALILGMSPITIAIYGNIKQKVISFRSLILPCFFITIGLVFVNLNAFDEHSDILYFGEYLLGLMFAFTALIAWTWFAVANAKILKDHSEISSSDWVTMLGAATFVWVLVIAVLFCLFGGKYTELSKYTNFSTELSRFVIGSSILGILCSWVGSYLWNRASTSLPVSILGQLIIFETIFGLIFVHFFERNVPSVTSLIGMAMMLFGIVTSVNIFRKRISLPEH